MINKHQAINLNGNSMDRMTETEYRMRMSEIPISRRLVYIYGPMVMSDICVHHVEKLRQQMAALRVQDTKKFSNYLRICLDEYYHTNEYAEKTDLRKEVRKQVDEFVNEHLFDLTIFKIGYSNAILKANSELPLNTRKIAEQALLTRILLLAAMDCVNEVKEELKERLNFKVRVTYDEAILTTIKAVLDTMLKHFGIDPNLESEHTKTSLGVFKNQLQFFKLNFD